MPQLAVEKFRTVFTLYIILKKIALEGIDRGMGDLREISPYNWLLSPHLEAIFKKDSICVTVTVCLFPWIVP